MLSIKRWLLRRTALLRWTIANLRTPEYLGESLIQGCTVYGQWIVLPGLGRSLAPDATDLLAHERRVFSQNGEDGVLRKLFLDLGGEATFLEIGTGDGTECNTRWLRKQHGWRGVMLDAEHEHRAIGLHRAFVTADNVGELLRAHSVSEDIDLVSIDVDGIDFYVWHALPLRPRVLVIEYNAKWRPPLERVVRYDPRFRWDGTDYFGASLAALARLGAQKGMVLVYAESAGVNAFFVRADLVPLLRITGPIGETAKLWRPPGYRWHPADPFRRPWLSFEEAIASHA